eukprot:3381817-Alexandrium_andersonii.AAC.1
MPFMIANIMSWFLRSGAPLVFPAVPDEVFLRFNAKLSVTGDTKATGKQMPARTHMRMHVNPCGQMNSWVPT